MTSDRTVGTTRPCLRPPSEALFEATMKCQADQRVWSWDICVFFFPGSFSKIISRNMMCIYKSRSIFSIRFQFFIHICFYRKTVFDSRMLIKFKHQPPMISSRNDCPSHPWDRKTGWCPSPCALESCAQRKCDQRPRIGNIFVGTKAGGGQL